jgi:hypothetical protein
MTRSSAALFVAASANHRFLSSRQAITCAGTYPRCTIRRLRGRNHFQVCSSRRGTGSSNPLPSSGESGANLIFGGESRRWRTDRLGGGAPTDPEAPADFDRLTGDRHHPVHQIRVHLGPHPGMQEVPGIVFVKTPRAWIEDETFADRMLKLADRFLVRSPSIVSVKYYTVRVVQEHLEVLVAELLDRYAFGVKSHGRWP